MLLGTLVATSFVTDGCGSAPMDAAAARDATADDVGDACGAFVCFDADAQHDGVAPIVCPDAGYYLTINGDGVAKTLSSSFYGVPVAEFIDCCGYTALGIVASENADGGTAVLLEQASSENPDGGLTFQAGPNIAAYYRSDGSTFSLHGDASLMTSYTQVDAPGGVVAGSYTVTVATSTQPDAATLSLSGTFFTCRMGDSVCACPPPPAP